MSKNSTAAEHIGFVGLGNMGAGIATNILRAGYEIIVHDSNATAAAALAPQGARLANSPADVARESDIVFTSLPGPREVEAVALAHGGIIEGVKPNAIYVDLSTVGPALIRRIEGVFREKHAHVLDAPVSGGKLGAQSGTLAVMVGGPRDVFDRVAPILRAFGDNILYAGKIGSGCVSKLVHNLIGNSVRQCIAEGLTLGVKAGVEPIALWECVRRGSVGRANDLHDSLPRTMFRGTYEPAGFALSLARKDVGLAIDLARECEVPLPLGNVVEQFIVDAMHRGWERMDSTIVVQLQEERAGVKVRAPDIDVDRASAFISTHPEE